MSTFSELRKKRKGIISPTDPKPTKPVVSIKTPEPKVEKQVKKADPRPKQVEKPVPTPRIKEPVKPVSFVIDEVQEQKIIQTINDNTIGIVNQANISSVNTISDKLEQLQQLVQHLSTNTPALPVENQTDKLFANLNYRDFLVFLRENQNLHEMIPYHLKRIDKKPYRDKKAIQDYIDLVRLFLQKILAEE